MPTVAKGDINYISTNLAELGSKKLSDAPNGGRPTTDTTTDNNKSGVQTPSDDTEGKEDNK